MQIEKLSAEGMMAHIMALSKLSPKRQARIFDRACERAKKHPMTDEEEALLLGENGYFQDASGEYH